MQDTPNHDEPLPFSSYVFHLQWKAFQISDELKPLRLESFKHKTIIQIKRMNF